MADRQNHMRKSAMVGGVAAVVMLAVGGYALGSAGGDDSVETAADSTSTSAARRVSTTTTTSTTTTAATATSAAPTLVVAPVVTAVPTTRPAVPSVTAPPSSPPATAPPTTAPPPTHQFQLTVVAQSTAVAAPQGMPEGTYTWNPAQVCSGYGDFTPPDRVTIRDFATQLLLGQGVVDERFFRVIRSSGYDYCSYSLTLSVPEVSQYSFQVDDEDPIEVPLGEAVQNGFVFSLIYWGG